MKSSSIWNVLSIMLMLGVCLIAGIVGVIFADPNSALNPFPPSTPVPIIVLPSPTPTEFVVVLPPTWTPTPVISTTSGAATATPKVTTTPIPSRTPFILATRTPFVLPSPTKAPTNPFPTNAKVPLAGKCKVVEQSPVDGTSFTKGTEFTTAWTIQNTGDTTWEKDNVDVRFQTGDAMQKGANTADLPQSVAPNGSVKITITMIAPEAAGYHVTYWNFSSGSQVLCTFYVEILTEK